MTRYILIALLALIHVQFVWSAASKYCCHESDSATSHLGHHSHRHPSDLASPVSSEFDVTDVSNLLPHEECGICQNLVVQNASLLKVDQTEQRTCVKAAYTSVLYESAISGDIERPKWITTQG